MSCTMWCAASGSCSAATPMETNQGLFPPVSARYVSLQLISNPDIRKLTHALAYPILQIDWDGAAVPFDLPFDFFNTNLPRGIIFNATDLKFAVSNPPSGADDRFSSINAKAARDFITFSRPRLFTPTLDNVLGITFRIPGSSKNATVEAFGAVFVDVDKKRTTYIVAYDTHGCVITAIPVLPKKDGLSFAGFKVIGVHTLHEGIKEVPASVAKVVIKLGNRAISGTGASNFKFGDIVVLDDLLYSEPQHVEKNFTKDERDLFFKLLGLHRDGSY